MSTQQEATGGNDGELSQTSYEILVSVQNKMIDLTKEAVEADRNANIAKEIFEKARAEEDRIKSSIKEGGNNDDDDLVTKLTADCARAKTSTNASKEFYQESELLSLKAHKKISIFTTETFLPTLQDLYDAHEMKIEDEKTQLIDEIQKLTMENEELLTTIYAAELTTASNTTTHPETLTVTEYNKVVDSHNKLVDSYKEVKTQLDELLEEQIKGGSDVCGDRLKENEINPTILEADDLNHIERLDEDDNNVTPSSSAADTTTNIEEDDEEESETIGRGGATLPKDQAPSAPLPPPPTPPAEWFEDDDVEDDPTTSNSTTTTNDFGGGFFGGGEDLDDVPTVVSPKKTPPGLLVIRASGERSQELKASALVIQRVFRRYIQRRENSAMREAVLLETRLSPSGASTVGTTGPNLAPQGVTGATGGPVVLENTTILGDHHSVDPPSSTLQEDGDDEADGDLQSEDTSGLEGDYSNMADSSYSTVSSVSSSGYLNKYSDMSDDEYY